MPLASLFPDLSFPWAQKGPGVFRLRGSPGSTSKARTGGHSKSLQKMINKTCSSAAAAAAKKSLGVLVVNKTLLGF